MKEMVGLPDWLMDHESLFRKSRLPSLYSDLSVQKDTNPEGYAANVTAWQSALTRAALAGQLPSGNRLTLKSSDELLNALASPQYGRPSGLGLVLDEGVRSGKMIDIHDFHRAEQSIYQRSWVPSPWAVVKWGLQHIGVLGHKSYDYSGRLRGGHLVLIAALEEITKQVVAAQETRGHKVTDLIETREDFVNHLTAMGGVPFTVSDVDVILRYLARDRQLLSYNATTIKFKSPGSTIPEPISQEDITIASLKKLLSGLEIQISGLEKTIEGLQSRAQAAVKSKNKQAALSALRSKRLAEQALQQRSDTYHQLEQIYSKIEQAVDQLQVVEAMQASAGVLKALNQKIGGVEKVENVVEDLREQMTQVDEVGQILEEPLDSKAVIDETEVDEEFEAMMKEETRAREETEAVVNRKRLEELPAVGAVARAELDKSQEEDNRLRSSIEQLDRLSIKSSGATSPPVKITEYAS